jgi:hypothetical protein
MIIAGVSAYEPSLFCRQLYYSHSLDICISNASIIGTTRSVTDPIDAISFGGLLASWYSGGMGTNDQT